MKHPKPDTREAWLYSESARRFTKHHYVETIQTATKGPNAECWAHMFECELTRVRRIWGVEPRKVGLN